MFPADTIFRRISGQWRHKILISVLMKSVCLLQACGGGSSLGAASIDQTPLPQREELAENTSPVEEDTTPVEENTNPVEEDTTPVEEDTTPVEEDTTPVEEVTTPVRENNTLVIDNFSDTVMYNNNLNGLGLYTSDDNTLTTNTISNNALHISGPENAYWYSLLSNGNCITREDFNYIKITGYASEDNATLQLATDLTALSNCALRDDVSYRVPVTFNAESSTHYISFARLGISNDKALYALVLNNFAVDVNYHIEEIALVLSDSQLDNSAEEEITVPTPASDEIVWTFEDQFQLQTNDWTTRMSTGGYLEFGYNDTQKNVSDALLLMLPGNPAFGSSDNKSPFYATEAIRQEETHFGRYEMGINFASCSSHEEVVNGIFIYKNDGNDYNNNGITDNIEIDIELLCGDPHVLWLSSWTDYGFNSETGQYVFRKKSRAINMHTGDFIQTPDGGEGSYDNVPAGHLANVRMTDFPNPQTYYTVGFDWQPEYIRWYILNEGEEITLWTLTDSSVIPQHPAHILFNVWHADSHWFSGGAADYPSQDATMKVDFVRYAEGIFNSGD